MNRELVVGLFIAVVLVLMLAFTLLDIWTATPEGPNYGLALVLEDNEHDAPRVEGCDCEDCTEDDPMDAYLEERAAGNGVLPAVVEVKVPPKIHYKCADFQLDGEPSKVCPDCAPLLEGVKPVVTR